MQIDISQRLTAPQRAEIAFAKARGAARVQLVDLLDSTSAAITGPVPQDEKTSWPSKEIAARAWLECGPDGLTAPERKLLEAECALTGETLDVLVPKIIRNADAYRDVIGALTGIRREISRQIDAATTAENVAACMEAAGDLCMTVLIVAAGREGQANG